MRLLIVSVAAATLALAACKKEDNTAQPTDITGEAPSTMQTQVQLTPAAPATTDTNSTSASDNTSSMTPAAPAAPSAPATPAAPSMPSTSTTTSNS